MSCKHNQRARYTHGFYCEDCKTFFPKDSPTYRSDELMSSIYMVLHNIWCDTKNEECLKMRDKIGIGIKHENYEELISEAEIIMEKHSKNSESASIALKEP